MGCLCSKSRKEEKDPLIAKSPYKAAEGNKAKAIKDYNAKNSTEISFTIGQLLDIVDKTQREYWMGQVEGQPAFGWFPSMCVMLIDEKEAIFQMEKQRIAGETLRRKTQLDMSKEASSSSSSDRKSVTVNASGKVLRARALKPYSGDSTSVEGAPVSDANSFISFSAGDVLVITDKSKADWWLGHIEGRTNTWGWFPTDHVEIIDSP